MIKILNFSSSFSFGNSFSHQNILGFEGRTEVILKGSNGDKTFTTIHQNNYLNANIFRALSSCSQPEVKYKIIGFDNFTSSPMSFVFLKVTSLYSNLD